MVLDEAQSDTERSGARWFEAEIWRLRAAALQISGRTADVARSAERAIQVARQQQARLWELRAATVLARHLAEEGEQGQAQRLLGPIHGWFTEGFDTKDVIEAKALLDGLR